MQHTDLIPLAELGVVSTAPGTGDTSALWRATFLGGVDAVTVFFAEEPEDRALDELCKRFRQHTVHIGRPTADRPAGDDPKVDEVAAAVLADGLVQQHGVTAEQVAAVVAALGGLRTPAAEPPFDTAPEDPRHVGQLLDHLAHLSDAQIAEVRSTLAQWEVA